MWRQWCDISISVLKRILKITIESEVYVQNLICCSLNDTCKGNSYFDIVILQLSNHLYWMIINRIKMKIHQVIGNLISFFKKSLYDVLTFKSQCFIKAFQWRWRITKWERTDALSQRCNWPSKSEFGGCFRILLHSMRKYR